jgi:16S rRNA A1518/A1519 N6-dimethyltransferase RsmA/KsgA/DIM1 with predicted DNA glycosylase/AP lyase activity
VESILRDAGVDPGLRGEQLSLQDFVAIAQLAKKVT